MMFLDKIFKFFNKLPKKIFNKIFFGYIFLIFLFCTLNFYFYFKKINFYKNEILNLSLKSKEISKILSKYRFIKDQKDKVEKLIKNDKNFYLQKFATDLFNSIEVKSFDLGKLISSPVRDSNFKEEFLTINIKNINTKNLCDFLDYIDKNNRVYVKYLNINRDKKMNTININTSIATLNFEKL